MTDQIFLSKAIGRRKEAIAQVTLCFGNGEFLINGYPANTYLQQNPHCITCVDAPLKQLQKDYSEDESKLTNLNIYVKVKGGGIVGQAEAIKLGVARALCEIKIDYRKFLKDKGYLTQDSRVKERRKYGLKKARKASQYHKR
uniref:Small ribosomal subunit protein uS9c n=1 Tax=Oedocladium prescottii TaxID=337949 RepID=A0A8K1N0E0_9CHLO|nr:ribosomal protein S9 [Oedocladium prescottii]